MLGPSIGCLYIRKEVAEEMKPFIVGGGTITSMVNSKPNFMESPHKFEAGLQNYAGAIGLRAAVEYIDSVGLKNIEKHEIMLNKIMTEGLENVKNISILGGSPEERGGILSFN